MSDKDSKPPAENQAYNKREPGAPKQSGRVAYDSKGNPVWEWETSTGVFDKDVSTQRLKKLEAKLSLEETQPVPKPKSLAVQEPERLPGGGMNPYDSGGKSNASQPAAHPALIHKQAARKPVSNSLVSKYAKTPNAKSKEPGGFWQKLKSKLKSE
jgi:hypothetical protein